MLRSGGYGNRFGVNKISIHSTRPARLDAIIIMTFRLIACPIHGHVRQPTSGELCVWPGGTHSGSVQFLWVFVFGICFPVCRFAAAVFAVIYRPTS